MRRTIMYHGHILMHYQYYNIETGAIFNSHHEFIFIKTTFFYLVASIGRILNIFSGAFKKKLHVQFASIRRPTQNH